MKCNLCGKGIIGLEHRAFIDGKAFHFQETPDERNCFVRYLRLKAQERTDEYLEFLDTHGK